MCEGDEVRACVVCVSKKRGIPTSAARRAWMMGKSPRLSRLGVSRLPAPRLRCPLCFPRGATRSRDPLLARPTLLELLDKLSPRC